MVINVLRTHFYAKVLASRILGAGLIVTPERPGRRLTSLHRSSLRVMEYSELLSADLEFNRRCESYARRHM